MQTSILTERTKTHLVRVETRVETIPLEIDYADILAAVEIKYDECTHEAPWEICDGWQHRLIDPPDDSERANLRGLIRHNRDYRGQMVEISRKAGLPDWRYFHARGASRQTARQLAGHALRQAVEQLVSWYDNGWEWWGVTCDFKHGGETFHASVWGIESHDYARDTARFEIAGEIVAELEKAGFEVTGQPARRTLKYGWTPEDWRQHFKGNLNSQNLR